MMMENPALLTGNFQHPYRFTGKELDKLNGLNMYDFGARLYDVAGVPMWTSVDPLCEKYYDISPYVYCHNSPVIRIDPNGKDDYHLNANGYLSFWRRSNARTTDRIYAANGEEITISKNVTQQMLAGRKDYNGNYAVGKGNEMINLFHFVANNTNVEWKLNGYKGKGEPTYLLATSHREDGVTITNGENNELNLFISIHNHPAGSPAKASGYGKNSEQNGRLFSYGDDQYNVNTIYNRFKEAKKAYPSQYPKFYIYHTETQTRIGYDPDKPITSVIKIRTALDLIK